MNAQIRRKLDMAERVLVFNRTHPSTDPGLTPVFEQLEERVGKAIALIQQQEKDRNRSKAGTALRQTLRRRLGQGLLALISKVGQAAARADSSLEAAFVKVPDRLTSLTFIPIAERLVGAARQHLEVLQAYGLNQPLVDEAEALLARYVAATDEVNTALQGRIEGNLTLREVTREIMDLTGRIDRFNRHRFADNPDILGAWDSARNVVGPTRKQGEASIEGAPTEPDPVEPAPVEPAPAEPAPAESDTATGDDLKAA